MPGLPVAADLVPEADGRHAEAGVRLKIPEVLVPLHRDQAVPRCRRPRYPAASSGAIGKASPSMKTRMSEGSSAPKRMRSASTLSLTACGFIGLPGAVEELVLLTGIDVGERTRRRGTAVEENGFEIAMLDVDPRVVVRQWTVATWIMGGGSRREAPGSPGRQTPLRRSGSRSVDGSCERSRGERATLPRASALALKIDELTIGQPLVKCGDSISIFGTSFRETQTT